MKFMEQEKCHFSLEIMAPDGLEVLTGDINRAGLNLYMYKSGYNGKTILRNSEGVIDLDMDSSDTACMFASGTIDLAFDQAKSVVSKLSDIFKKNKLPHLILLDNETSEETHIFSYEWDGK